MYTESITRISETIIKYGYCMSEREDRMEKVSTECKCAQTAEQTR